MMKNKQYRQGDVLIEQVAKIVRKPSNCLAAEAIVLAEGEATGHAHVLRTSAKDPADWWKDGEEQFANISAPAEVTHEEHGRIELPEGTYRIVRQREYTPEAIRHVGD